MIFGDQPFADSTAIFANLMLKEFTPIWHEICSLCSSTTTWVNIESEITVIERCDP